MDDPLVDGTPRFSRINAANHEIDVRVGRRPAWLGGGRVDRKRWRCRFRHSRPPGCESAVPAVEDRGYASSSLSLQSFQVLVQRFLLNERRNREALLPCQASPKRSRSAAARGQAATTARMSELALEERLLPSID